jgi:hypothetical protein
MHWNYISVYFFSQWLLHVSAKQCHSQGATIFLYEPPPRQYGRRQVTGHMPEPTHRRADSYIARRCVGSVICLVTSLLPYWRWSGSYRKTVAPWGWHCFAETCRSHCEKNKEIYNFSAFGWLISTNTYGVQLFIKLSLCYLEHLDSLGLRHVNQLFNYGILLWLRQYKYYRQRVQR